MTDRELVAFLGRKIEQAMNDEDGDISDVRIENYNLYVGKPYGNERDGYSSVVTREGLETVEWIMPLFLKAFTGTGAVSFDPEGPDDEDQAEQETDVAQHILLKKNNGFLALHHWGKDCLMFPNGYVKLGIEERERTRVEHYRGLSAFGLQQVLTSLANKGDADVIEQESAVVNSIAGPLEVYEVKVRVTWQESTPAFIPVPPDELLIDNDCLSIDLDEADFVCHRVRKSYTQLINEGKDPDLLDAVGESEDYQWLDERTNRLFYEDEDPDSENEDDWSMREFWVHDCYCYVDFDGDGLGEFRHIEMIGAEIFENEETDYQPFVSGSAILIPHKHAGLSYLDIVKDIQEIKSTLWRQLLDNVYKMNVPRKYVGENFISDEGGTLDVMLDTMSEYIPARDPMAINQEQVQPMAQAILPVIQGVGDFQAVRTGVAPALSLDPSVMQQTTFGAFDTALEKASERVEMFIRIFAETAMKKLMAKAHQLLREHVDQPLTLKIRNKWVEFNPTDWHERENLSANVGLGFNRKEHKIALLQGLLALQEKALPMGLSRADKIFNTLEEMVEAGGFFGQAQRYFVDPESEEYQPPQPQMDPAIEVAMADVQQRGQKAQGDHQVAMGELQLKAQEQQSQMDQERQEFMRQLREMDAKFAELQKRLEVMNADIGLKDAQTARTWEEVDSQRQDNEAARSGLLEVLDGGQ